MLDTSYIRAEYDELRDAWVSQAAEWHDRMPSLMYFFAVEVDPDTPNRRQGLLEKQWMADESSDIVDSFLFGSFPTELEANAAVAQIRAEAEAHAKRDNLDPFLAIIDIVKARAIEAGLADEMLQEYEGLFEDGPEDAYSLRAWDDGPRLHDHVERADECWFLHVARVVDTDQQPLGWGVFAVHLPDLTAEADTAQRRAATRACVLLIEQHRALRDAKIARRGIYNFMDTERLEDPEYAFTDDTEMLENIGGEHVWNEDAPAVQWDDLSGQALTDFASGTVPYRYPREKWQPPDKPVLDRFFEEHPVPTWLEDQFRAMLDSAAGVTPDDDEVADPNSPWQDVDWED